MARLRSLHDALLFGTIAFFVAYGAPFFVKIPLPWYLPLSRVWVFTTKPSELGMGWYGQTLFAMLVGFAAAALAWIATRNAPTLSAARSRGAAIALFVAAAAVMTLYVVELVPRVPKPEPIPAWYQPR